MLPDLKMEIDGIRFTSHEMTGKNTTYCEDIRFKAKDFAIMINEYCKDGREKSVALTKLEEVTFWANASIARHGSREG